MKKSFNLVKIICFAIFILTGCVSMGHSEDHSILPFNTFIVLAEMNSYTGGYTDIDVAFINSQQMKELFLSLGVPEENFFLIRDSFDVDGIYNTFDWIDKNVPQDATLIYYAAAHGMYFRNTLHWNSIFPERWRGLPQEDKILIIDSCHAGEFVAPFNNDFSSGITYGVVAAKELSWWGIEEEELPIIGSVWVHYFVEALTSPQADIDGSGSISFTEAHEYTNTEVQKYMKQYVFSVPMFRSSYLDLGQRINIETGYPKAVMNNNLSHDLILTVVK